MLSFTSATRDNSRGNIPLNLLNITITQILRKLLLKIGLLIYKIDKFWNNLDVKLDPDANYSFCLLIF